MTPKQIRRECVDCGRVRFVPAKGVPTKGQIFWDRWSASSQSMEGFGRGGGGARYQIRAQERQGRRDAAMLCPGCGSARFTDRVHSTAAKPVPRPAATRRAARPAGAPNAAPPITAKSRVSSASSSNAQPANDRHATADPPPAKADWYPDPKKVARLRYWDGQAWTEHVSEDFDAKADWYPDPKKEARLRYWDGQAWTDHVAL
jgi:Protein of unknown function (DUF2510)